MRIKKAEYIEGYKIKLLFNDNKTKIVDLEEFIKNGKGMYIPLKDLEYFKKVVVDNDYISICWPNGADFSPDVLYEKGIDVEKTKKKPVRLRKKITHSIPQKSQIGIAAKSKH